MRISTVTMYEQSMNSLNKQQGEFMRVGQQIATGRKVVNPSDDPQAASRAGTWTAAPDVENRENSATVLPTGASSGLPLKSPPIWSTTDSSGQHLRQTCAYGRQNLQRHTAATPAMGRRT